MRSSTLADQGGCIAGKLSSVRIADGAGRDSAKWGRVWVLDASFGVVEFGIDYADTSLSRCSM